jgi:hypothetical protein
MNRPFCSNAQFEITQANYFAYDLNTGSSSNGAASGKMRTMRAAARRKIAAAQRRVWAKLKLAWNQVQLR